ncbi:MAG TPA: metalloregulator ArsR/SmtB family transcription factor [Candidatus Woesebacteria bacterium]|nr:metalloregulator ArsR/SmtB family transcription factor [Candidatus Woesebacteria bacterium]HPJ17073.1 metalloregulator ArsR/SmtB family transcription factor [Candidatus Woesebacteria bacterium]
MDKIFKALSDINRRRIITMLVKNGPMNVTQIVENLPIGQSTTSTHLNMLKKAGLVEFLVNNRERIYKINKQTIKSFVQVINEFFGSLESKDNVEIIVRRK